MWYLIYVTYLLANDDINMANSPLLFTYALVLSYALVWEQNSTILGA